MARILILGGGFGGLATASALRARLPADHDIVVIDRNQEFFMGLRKLWVMVGLDTYEAGTRARQQLVARGIQFQQTEIRSIDPQARRVDTEAGAIVGDYLVVALGSEPRADLIVGLMEHGYNLYDAAPTAELGARVRDFKSGRIAVVIAGLPYKCPPAPYEATMLLEDHFRRRGLGDRVEIVFTTLQPALLPNAGPEGHRRMAEVFSQRGITYHTGRVVRAFEPGQVVYDSGAIACDLAACVPPHRAPPVVAESDLAGEGGWVSVDRHTLATRFPRVFAIGDSTHIPLAAGAALPKAGLFAEAHGTRVAESIAAEILGTAGPPDFDGRGYCYMEMGAEEATLVQGEFYAEGGPKVELKETSAAMSQEKRRFETERLARWFGA